MNFSVKCHQYTRKRFSVLNLPIAGELLRRCSIDVVGCEIRGMDANKWCFTIIETSPV